MIVRFSTLLASGTLRQGRMALAAAFALGAAPADALASPDCSKVGPRPSAECAVKLEYCRNTSIVLVLAVRGRASGMSESDNASRLTTNKTREPWYETYHAVVEDIVHQIYSKEATYRKLRARIAPSMALAVAALAAGCNADTSVTVDTRRAAPAGPRASGPARRRSAHTRTALRTQIRS